jgi:GT2 family glycosyltransferase
MPSPLAEARQKLVGALHARGVRRVSAWVEAQTRRERFVDWVSGACVLVRRSDLETVGLLDERYFLYWEDVDLCAELRLRGRRILFTPAAEIVHLRGRSAASNQTAARQAYRRAQLLFYAKHRPACLPVLRAYLRARDRLAGGI